MHHSSQPQPQVRIPIVEVPGYFTQKTDDSTSNTVAVYDLTGACIDVCHVSDAPRIASEAECFRLCYDLLDLCEVIQRPDLVAKIQVLILEIRTARGK